VLLCGSIGESEAAYGRCGKQFDDATALKIEVRDATVPTNDSILTVQTSDSGGYRSIGGLELSLREAGDGFVRRHLLQVLLCQEWRVVVTVNVITGNNGDNRSEPVQPPRDVQLALMPMYRQTVDHEAPRASQMLGYLSKPEKVGTTLGQLQFAAEHGAAGTEAAARRRIFPCRACEPIVSQRRDAVRAVPPLGVAGPAGGAARCPRHRSRELYRGGSVGRATDWPLVYGPRQRAKHRQDGTIRSQSPL
jgi:hypothetical protein